MKEARPARKKQQAALLLHLRKKDWCTDLVLQIKTAVSFQEMLFFGIENFKRVFLEMAIFERAM